MNSERIRERPNSFQNFLHTEKIQSLKHETTFGYFLIKLHNINFLLIVMVCIITGMENIDGICPFHILYSTFFLSCPVHFASSLATAVLKKLLYIKVSLRISTHGKDLIQESVF